MELVEVIKIGGGGVKKVFSKVWELNQKCISEIDCMYIPFWTSLGVMDRIYDLWSSFATKKNLHSKSPYVFDITYKIKKI